MNPNEKIIHNYNIARSNLLLVVGLTVVNLILLVAQSNMMLLFSATVPYLAVLFGYGSGIPVFTVASVAFALALIALYFLCWLFSKKHYGWMIAALVLFSVDTLVLCGFYVFAGEISGILDVVIHAMILYYLISGVINGFKLHKMPEESVVAAETVVVDEFIPEPEVSAEDNADQLM